MNGVPPLPRLLGLAGILPQLAACLAVYFGPAGWREPALSAGTLYAALIFTFLGGMWWGMAAAATTTTTATTPVTSSQRGTPGWVWFVAVAPSLIAFAILFALQFAAVFRPEAGMAGWQAAALLLLGGLIALSPMIDKRLERALGSTIVPSWWFGLRWPLSLGLGGASIALALG